MIEYDGEHYLTANEVAKRFHLSWGTCATNLLSHMQACHLPGRKRVFYCLSDVDQFAPVRLEAQTPCKMLPAPTLTTSEAESTVTRTLTPLQRNAAGRAILAHLPAAHKTRKDA
jgi:hypothetical protein